MIVRRLRGRLQGCVRERVKGLASSGALLLLQGLGLQGL